MPSFFFKSCADDISRTSGKSFIKNKTRIYLNETVAYTVFLKYKSQYYYGSDYYYNGNCQ